MNPPPHFVFFPRPLPVSTASPIASTSKSVQYLYGWRGECEGAVVVAGALHAMSFGDAQESIKGIARQLGPAPGTEALCILGRCDLDDMSDKGKSNLGVDLSDSLVQIRVSDDGIPSTSDEALGTFVLYKPPSRSKLQFFSIVPLQLDLNSFLLPSHDTTIRADKTSPTKEEAEDVSLGNKIRRSSALDFSSARSNGGFSQTIDLNRAVDRINFSPHLTRLLRQPMPPLLTTPTIPSRPLPLPSPRRLVEIVKTPIHMLRLAAQLVVYIANRPIPMLGGTALKDFSATVHQFDTRLSQALSWPSQYTLIRQTLNSSVEASENASLALGRAHYIQFYNTMWLIANDVIVGGAFTSFVCDNSEYIGHQLGEIVQIYTLISLRELLVWLNSWPGGVKLNFELATIFCDAFLWGTGLWEEVIFTPLRQHLPAVVYLLGLSGLLGLTMFISFASDLLSLLTLHIYVFYFMATSVFYWHLRMLGSLFNIFRGKRFNVLRNRVEPAVYEVDQLLLGTILFTLAAFLFPTVLAYYLAFAASRLAIVVTHAAMETVVAFMNHFPLFAVMLRFKDPARLPGGLKFQLNTTRSKSIPYLIMTNNPVNLAGIFFQHVHLSRRLASHYSPIFLLGKLLAGHQISPIPRVKLRLWVDVGSVDVVTSESEGKLEI